MRTQIRYKKNQKSLSNWTRERSISTHLLEVSKLEEESLGHGQELQLLTRTGQFLLHVVAGATLHDAVGRQGRPMGQQLPGDV